MKDSDDIKSSYLYSLSKLEGLDWFEHIVLFGCHNDPYVSYDSAAILIPPKAIGTKKEREFKGLIENILDNIDRKKINRIEVDFKQSQLLDQSILFDTSHIDFLSDPSFIKMLCFGLPRLFL